MAVRPGHPVDVNEIFCLDGVPEESPEAVAVAAAAVVILVAAVVVGGSPASLRGNTSKKRSRGSADGDDEGTSETKRVRWNVDIAVERPVFPGVP